MSVRSLDAAPLVGEYDTLVFESRGSSDGEIEWEKLQGNLVSTAEWSHEGAAHLVRLAKSYGAFVLRNALALAVAADIEDGEIGL